MHNLYLPTKKLWLPDRMKRNLLAHRAIMGASGRIVGDEIGYVFDGDDYLSIPDHADWNLGNGDFTIDFRFKTEDGSVQNGIVGQSVDANNYWQIQFHDGSTQVFNFVVVSGGTQLINLKASYALSNYTWVHVAIVKSGNSTDDTEIYVDGTKQTGNLISGSWSYTVPDLAAQLTVGSIINETVFTQGWIDELRISKGTARWTSNFTSPITQYNSDANTSLLIHCGETKTGTTGSGATFTDSGNTGHTVTENGNAKESKMPLTGTDQVLYRLDGAADFLTVPDHADWDFGTGDFTLEMFTYLLDTTPSDNCFMDIQDGFQTTGIGFDWVTNDRIDVYINGSLTIAASSLANIFAYEWCHYALVREGSTLTLYQNGVSIGSASNSTSIAISDIIRIGARYGGTSPYQGFMKEIRISNVARYSAGFTPTTSPFVSDSNTKLLIHCGETKTGTSGSGATFTDSGNTGHTVTENGNAIAQENVLFKF